VVLEGEPHRYLSRVLRLQPGDALVLFDGEGQEIEARLEAVSTRATTLALGARRTVAPPARRVTLLQAVPRGERMEFVVQKTAELGLHRLCPVWSARTVGKGDEGDDGGSSRLRRWRKIAEEAARQCGRADLPVIEPPRPLAEALAALDGPSPAGLRLLLWEAAPLAGDAVPLRQALAAAGPDTAVTLLVGPEGGFTPDEAEVAQRAGFQVVGLGPLILRSETAALVAVALAQAALGALD
jgi:16S rRNA (uracil1498-N3)-methyltransferase